MSVSGVLQVQTRHRHPRFKSSHANTFGAVTHCVCLFECVWVAAHVAEVHQLKCYVLRCAVRVVTSLAADAFMYHNAEMRLSCAVVTIVSTFVRVAWVCDP